MKNSKIILAGSTLILAIAGAFVSKAARTSHQLRQWTCTGSGKCSASYGVLTHVTKQSGSATVTHNFNKVHTCASNANCGATIHVAATD